MFDITSHLGNENQKQNKIIHYETTMKERGNEREGKREGRKCGQGYGETGIHKLYWWEHKMVQSLG